jgi:hypothetical protein
MTQVIDPYEFNNFIFSNYILFNYMIKKQSSKFLKVVIIECGKEHLLILYKISIKSKV